MRIVWILLLEPILKYGIQLKKYKVTIAKDTANDYGASPSFFFSCFGRFVFHETLKVTLRPYAYLRDPDDSLFWYSTLQV